MLELTNELMENIDKNTHNDITASKMKVYKNNLIKTIEKFNSFIKHEIEKKYTENNTEPHTENNTEPDTEIVAKKKNTKPDAKINTDLATSDDIKAHIIDKQKLIKKRYKSLLETKKTIKNKIELKYTALKILPKESQSKLTELVRLGAILNDSINVIWRENYERDKKGITKIDVNKIKNVDAFIYQFKKIINNKIVLLKTSVIVKLNLIISDIKEKSKVHDVYNFNDIDKLFIINNDLDKYMKILKKNIGSIKQILKTISANQTDSHATLMKLLK